MLKSSYFLLLSKHPLFQLFPPGKWEMGLVGVLQAYPAGLLLGFRKLDQRGCLLLRPCPERGGPPSFSSVL